MLWGCSGWSHSASIQGKGNDEHSGGVCYHLIFFSLSVCFSTWDSKSQGVTALIQSGSFSQLTCLERPLQKCPEMCQASNSNPVKLTNEDEPLHSFNSESPNLKNDYKDCTNWRLVLNNSKRNKALETVNTVLTNNP